MDGGSDGGAGGTGWEGHGWGFYMPASAAASYFRPMGFWRRLLGGGSSTDDITPQRLDYLNEALALERQGDL